ncbi:MAG: cyclic lactone autoinducer peptide [Lachnospiraceae bacterium]|nr:cyclic lactone autoinducer peptide [Lachnospiraceae bacterium]
MSNKMEKVILKKIAKLSDPEIIVDYPWCPFFFHQPKRPESLRKCVNDKKASK